MSISTALPSVDAHVSLLQKAENLLSRGQDDHAESVYKSLAKVPGIAAITLFRLGEIANRRGDAVVSSDLHRRAYLAESRLASKITAPGHPFHDYVYRNVPQAQTGGCPICAAAGKPYWAFNMVTNADFNEGFDPVRTWMLCESCNHIYASARPEKITDVLSGSENEQYAKPRVDLLSYMGAVVSGLKRAAPGKRFLDVGVGAGEMMAVAREYGFEAKGLEIRPAHADRVSRILGLEVICGDFNDYTPGTKYDIICMGDVLEHMTDPVGAVGKASSLLGAGGILWISTPNFESAFSVIMKDSDPMKRVCEHLNYFSFGSLEKILLSGGFSVVDYRISGHYNGSMEVTAMRAERPAPYGGSPESTRVGEIHA